MLGVLVPEKYGGSGFGYDEYVVVVSEIAKVCGSIGLSVAAHNSLCIGHILKFGTEKQKLKWLPQLCSGENIGAWIRRRDARYIGETPRFREIRLS